MTWDQGSGAKEQPVGYYSAGPDLDPMVLEKCEREIPESESGKSIDH